jgi:hypothetical protein
MRNRAARGRPLLPRVRAARRDEPGQCPERRPPRVRQDQMLTTDIHRVWHENQEVYGVRKV